MPMIRRPNVLLSPPNSRKKLMSTHVRNDLAQLVPLRAALIALVFLPHAVGQQQPPTAPPAVQPASFDRATPRDAGQTVRFGQRAARVGDEIEQTISLEMRLATSLRQGNELIQKNQTAVRSFQRRTVATTEVDRARAIAVKVRYHEANKQMTSTDTRQADNGSAEPQPVQGKTYRCRREPGQNGKLLVTDDEGRIPPLNEYEIVAQGMEMVGRANPLAEFLGGRTMAVGETVALPKDLAERVFNLGSRFGEVVRFDLTLEKLETEEAAPRALFQAKIEAASNDSSQMRMQVEGPLIVEIDTCRAAHANLSGPIGMSEKRGTYSASYQLIGTGQLKMSVASAYRDAVR